MDIFFTNLQTPSEATLDGDQFRHATRVLRKRVGDPVRLTDGRGMFHDGVISRIDRNSASIEIRSSSMVDPPSYSVYIEIGFTKNHNRIEWCLEKLTELGVDSIIPILT